MGTHRTVRFVDPWIKLALILLSTANAALQDWNSDSGIGFTSYKRSIIPGQTSKTYFKLEPILGRIADVLLDYKS